nr:unnamed protein product [Callosobruchus analis]
MDPLYVIIDDGRLSPLSFDSMQSTLIFPAPQVLVQVGNGLLHELEDDLAALADAGDSDEDAEVDAEGLVDAGEAVDNDGVAEDAWVAREVADDDEQSNDSACFSSA